MIFAEDIFNSIYIVFTHTILIEMVYQAAVIGLGNIGFRFSYDAKRKGTWSHVDAYKQMSLHRTVGAVEIDRTTIESFSFKISGRSCISHGEKSFF